MGPPYIPLQNPSNFFPVSYYLLINSKHYLNSQNIKFIITFSLASVIILLCGSPQYYTHCTSTFHPIIRNFHCMLPS